MGLRSDRGPVLLAMLVAQALIALDATVLATAVPSIVSSLGGFSAFPWMFSIYLLASSVTVPLYSKLADTLGRKGVLMVGIVIFLIGSILCGVAWNMTSLILFRALQGVGAGAIQPVSVTVVGDMYSVAERARVQGYIASVWGGASVLGPTIGGVFAMLDAWRWIFFINIPLSLVALGIIWRNYREQYKPRPHRIDFAGALLFAASMTLLIIGALEGGSAWTWDSPMSIGFFAGGAVLFVGFLLAERRAAEPVLPLSLFRRRVIASSSLVSFTFGVAVIGLTSYVPPYLQIGASVSPLFAGLALAMFMVGRPIAGSLSGRIFLRKGFRFAALLGAAISIVGMLVLVLVAPWPNPWTVGGVCLLVGLGLGLVAVPSLVAAQSSVEWGERGVVSGVVMLSRSLGSAIGAAILGAVGNAVIAARGGGPGRPSTMIAAASAVFIGVGIVSVLMFLGALAMPRERAESESGALPVDAS